MFSDNELAYLKSQKVARIATVSKVGQPDLVPVVLEFDGTYFWVGSHGEEARKYRNVLAGNNRVAITVDDVVSFNPWKTRAIRIYGTATIMEHNGLLGHGKYLRITPNLSWSFGLNPNPDRGHGWASTKTVHH